MGGSVRTINCGAYASRMRIEIATVIVDDYDLAIEFFVGVLGFELVDNSAAPRTNADQNDGSLYGHWAPKQGCSWLERTANTNEMPSEHSSPEGSDYSFEWTTSLRRTAT